MEMRTMHVRVTFIEPVLGLSPSNSEIYRDYIGSKAPDAYTLEDEIEALGEDAVTEKGMTVFPRTADGKPFFWDYQVKGYFKDTCGGLRKVPGSESCKLKSYKKVIDKLIFPGPRRIVFENYGTIMDCQRPLRAETAAGPRISLAISEEIPAGARLTFDVITFGDYDKLLREWFDYGVFSGMSQWRNSGKGRFRWEELDEQGKVIGGNKLLS